ncbi:hypothetical protein [Ahrensia sp. 13_GOM-1096m]|uniref:hypothetical protein n=1 Tax=Ahrensia sp. 13_GOM-1096m TaxID=1380380 RepID=UPI00047D103A|nr:hypothetical protein [Ahrensia sp. 13_GOM-1096m]
MAKENAYIRYFGRMESLGDEIPWTEGVSNIYEHIAWYTASVLGVSKTVYWQRILNWVDVPEIAALTMADKVAFVKKRLADEVNASEAFEPYETPQSLIAKPYECLRRARYFSEDYLNKEFDIFMSLASDAYINSFFTKALGLQFDGCWTTHGNGGRFQTSTMPDMQMDNLCYDREHNQVVACELKLGGRKNIDQLLKYGLLFKRLQEMSMSPAGTRHCLLFISDKEMELDWDALIEKEIFEVARRNSPSCTKLLDNDVVSTIRNTHKASIRWQDLQALNVEWLAGLTEAQSVEKKLLVGFNKSLAEKFHLQVAHSS